MKVFLTWLSAFLAAGLLQNGHHHALAALFAANTAACFALLIREIKS